MEQLQNNGDYIEIITLVELFYYGIGLIFLILLFFFLYQRVWSFMIIRGMEPYASFSERIKISRYIGSKGFAGFVFLLLTHILIQILLTSMFSPVPFEFEPGVGYNGLVLVSTAIGPLEFLLFSLYEVGFFLILIIYQINQVKQSEVSQTDDDTHKEITTIIDPIKTIKRSQSIADLILKKNPKGISTRVSGSLIFSEVIETQTVLFFQDSPENIPVAMNYSVHFPEKIRAISPDSQIQVNVPNTNQMEKFIILSRNLESKQEEDLTP